MLKEHRGFKIYKSKYNSTEIAFKFRFSNDKEIFKASVQECIAEIDKLLNLKKYEIRN